MGEPARDDDGVDAGDGGVAVPQQASLGPQGGDGLDHVELAVGPRELDDADDGAHRRPVRSGPVHRSSAVAGRR